LVWGLRGGQTFVEYTILISLIGGILIAMTPLIRRSAQGMVKVIADQVGNQVNAEQSGGDQGLLELSETQTQIDTSKVKTEALSGAITYQFLQERVKTDNETKSDLGVTRIK
jgi:hypothetical protein